MSNVKFWDVQHLPLVIADQNVLRSLACVILSGQARIEQTGTVVRLEGHCRTSDYSQQVSTTSMKAHILEGCNPGKSGLHALNSLDP